MGRKDEETSLTPLYVAIGVVAAAAIGWAVWRYALSDSQKERAVDAVRSAGDKAKGAMQSAMHR